MYHSGGGAASRGGCDAPVCGGQEGYMGNLCTFHSILL